MGFSVMTSVLLPGSIISTDSRPLVMISEAGGRDSEQPFNMGKSPFLQEFHEIFLFARIIHRIS